MSILWRAWKRKTQRVIAVSGLIDVLEFTHFLSAEVRLTPTNKG